MATANKNFKIALIGKGKTGGKVREILESEGIEFETFNRTRPVSAKALQAFDAGIVFVAGDVFTTIMPELVASKLPLVIGATGWEIPPTLNGVLQENNCAWVWGSNFSLGMRLVHQMIQALQKTAQYFEDYQFDLHEVHHTKKLDGPSGTAKSWAQWLDLPVNITFERTGDVVGDHALTLTTAHEKIYLRHEALDRKIFAQGAVWAARKILESKLSPGFYYFENCSEYFK